MTRRTLRTGVAVVAVAAVAASPLWAPPLLARARLFPVSRVEVAGSRFIAPHEVLRLSGIRAGESVWSDPAVWERRLAGHPAIASVAVRRRLPGTLRIEVEEQQAVALVQDGALRPVTGDGRVLPVDPARVPLDLPIVRVDVRGGRVVAKEDVALLGEIQRLLALDPGLLSRVSEVRPAGEDLLLVLSASDVRVLVPRLAGPERLTQLRAALREVEPRTAAGALGAPQVQLDLRFRDQAVVRFPSRV